MSNLQQRAKYSVAIVGAGPAGSSCANALLLNGARNIALIDKAAFPRDKCCGDGLGPGVINELRELDLLEIFEDATPIHHISISGPSDVHATGTLPAIDGHEPVVSVIPRLVFDHKLTSSALKRGADDWTGWTLVDSEFNEAENLWLLKLRHTDDMIEQTIAADVLIGADGASSRVRRILSSAPNRDEQMGIAVRVYAKSRTPIPLSLRFDFLTQLLPAYGWVFPIDAYHANVGVGIDLVNYKSKGLHLRELLSLYQEQINIDFEYEPESCDSYILPSCGKHIDGHPMPVSAYPGRRAALIGDAASMINPVSGEGIFYGMFAGRLLGEKLARAISENSDPAPAICEYGMAFNQRFAQHFNLNRRLKKTIKYPFWCNFVIRACDKDAKVLADIVDILIGDQKFVKKETILRILLWNIWRF